MSLDEQDLLTFKIGRSSVASIWPKLFRERHNIKPGNVVHVKVLHVEQLSERKS